MEWPEDPGSAPVSCPAMSCPRLQAPAPISGADLIEDQPFRFPEKGASASIDGEDEIPGLGLGLEFGWNR